MKLDRFSFVKHVKCLENWRSVLRYSLALALKLLANISRWPLQEYDHIFLWLLHLSYTDDSVWIDESNSKTFENDEQYIENALPCKTTVYLDIVNFSKDFKSHVTGVKIILKHILVAELWVKIEKVSFVCNEVQLFGQFVSKEGVGVDLKRGRAISETPIPCSRTEQQSSLDLSSYYRAFLGKIGTIAVLLQGLRVLEAVMSVMIKWTMTSVVWRKCVTIYPDSFTKFQEAVCSGIRCGFICSGLSCRTQERAYTLH